MTGHDTDETVRDLPADRAVRDPHADETAHDPPADRGTPAPFDAAPELLAPAGPADAPSRTR